MKNIYFLVSLMLGVLVVTAQVPVNIASKPIVNNPAKAVSESRGGGAYYIDYEGYDDFVNTGNYQSFVTWVNNRYQSQGTNGDFLFAVETFDSLFVTPDYSNFSAFDYGSHSVFIDSVFYRGHHQNNSGLEDTIKVSIVELGPAPNYRPTNNVLWSNILTSSVDLTGHPTTPGSYPTGTFSDAPGITVPVGTRFGIRVDYYGDITDTFGLIFGYPHDGTTSCNGDPNVFSPMVSAFYPSAYYQARTSASASSLFPTTTNSGYWYYDCNGNSSPQWPQENPYQNWSMWAYINLTLVGTNDISRDGMNLFQNNPNPFSDKTVIRYSLQKASKASIEVTDLTGRVVAVLDQGFKSAGNFSTEFNAGTLTAGTYFYTLKTENGSVTNRMIIKR